MIIALRIFFLGILASMFAATTWASLHVALWEMPREVATHPWFITTLFDTYFAFLTFWLWVAWRERTWVARLGWLLGILLLGNFAMATYVLIRLFRLPRDARVEQVLLREPDSPAGPA